MANLATKYMGLSLRSPLIIGSSGLTHSVKNIIDFEQRGAGAVVLKSLFEEQIRQEINNALNKSETGLYPEAEDYIANYTKIQQVNEYLHLIRQCKDAVKIPIIASINCVTADEWTSFASRIEDAGADALELNVFILPSDVNRSGEQAEKIYFSILEKVKKHIKIPVALKISSYFSGLANTVQKLSWSGVNGMVLFNRFVNPDINIDKMQIEVSNIYSNPQEMNNTLRWVAILSDMIKTDIVASTGIHDGKTIIKMLLAGATAVQVASVLYQKGFGHVNEMLSELEKWMDHHNFKTIDEFKGKMSFKNTEDPAAYLRVQFMKHYSGIE
ncbi:MAG: dihydroorotate dehydrogenase-like protein [Bacteroidota bacterium]|nr:dihydroorotate dehydrogenase-like protein [Bacteroidota bacterium]MDP4290811.1 dihydroorotate dehydrogenase-like protein [Bacteroidota bacterium]